MMHQRENAKGVGGSHGLQIHPARRIEQQEARILTNPNHHSHDSVPRRIQPLIESLSGLMDDTDVYQWSEIYSCY
jgi:hypothetical protein